MKNKTKQNKMKRTLIANLMFIAIVGFITEVLAFKHEWIAVGIFSAILLWRFDKIMEVKQ